jgi:hypothetical protein
VPDGDDEGEDEEEDDDDDDYDRALDVFQRLVQQVHASAPK